jgi:hypothetical protein
MLYFYMKPTMKTVHLDKPDTVPNAIMLSETDWQKCIEILDASPLQTRR